MNALMKTKIKVAIAIFIAVNLLLSTFVFAADRDNTIAVSETQFGPAYEKFERELMENLKDGRKAIRLIDDLNYEASNDLTSVVNSKVIKATALHLEYGRVKEQLPSWAKPIYDYIEGVPESRWESHFADIVQPYEKVNAELRDGKPDSKETVAWIAQMRSALAQIPRYEGISFRGARLPKEIADKKYQLGKLADEPAFVSTSIKPEVALRFALPMENLIAKEYLKTNILFVVKGRTGRPLDALADGYAGEQEVLFANGTKFRVTAKSPLFKLTEVKGNNQIIVLHEEN